MCGQMKTWSREVKRQERAGREDAPRHMWAAPLGAQSHAGPGELASWREMVSTSPGTAAVLLTTCAFVLPGVSKRRAGLQSDLLEA